MRATGHCFNKTFLLRTFLKNSIGTRQPQLSFPNTQRGTYGLNKLLSKQTISCTLTWPKSPIVRFLTLWLERTLGLREVGFSPQVGWVTFEITNHSKGTLEKKKKKRTSCSGTDRVWRSTEPSHTFPKSNTKLTSNRIIWSSLQGSESP